MKKRKILVIMLIAVLCCGLLAGLTSCDTSSFVGEPTHGVTTNGVSQIDLQRVDYRYYISDYPKYVGYQFKETNSYVTATYTFYNSTLIDATMPLYLVTSEPSYSWKDFNDIARYKFTTTAEQEVIIRCAYHSDVADYSNNDYKTTVGNFLKCLYDEKRTDDTYNNDFLVYKYTFELSDLSPKVDHVLFEISKEYDDLTMFFDKGHDSNHDHISYVPEEGITEYCVHLNDTNALTLYSFDETELDGIEETAKFCKSNIVVENGGKITSVSREVKTFDDLLMTFYDEESNLSTTDWYNAALSSVKRNGLEYLRSLNYFNITNSLSYMYQCNLVVPAQGEAVLTVKMPLYPTVDCENYDKDVYEYELDLTALSNWCGSPEVNLSIVTDGYFVNSSVDLKETPTGFELNKISPSTKKLTFTLSEVPDFDKNKDQDKGPSSNENDSRFLVVLLIIIGIIYLVPIITVSVVLGYDRTKREKDKTLNKDETTTTKL